MKVKVVLEMLSEEFTVNQIRIGHTNLETKLLMLLYYKARCKFKFEFDSRTFGAIGKQVTPLIFPLLQIVRELRMALL
jgi:hypothetical protein